MVMRQILFAASECDPFIKTGGLADVVSSLPKALIEEGYDVRVIIPKYKCIPDYYKNQMEYVHHFYMDLGRDHTSYYVGIMKCVLDGVTYYFVDNEHFFSDGNPYTNMTEDAGKFVFFSKAVLAIMPVIGFKPDIIHCHDWQTGLIPVFLRTLYSSNEFYYGTKTIMTIHNLHFQGRTNIDTMKYITGLDDSVFTMDRMEYHTDANMLKGGIVFSDYISTVSDTYAGEIKTQEYGEGLDDVISFHHRKLCGIVNGIDYDGYNPLRDNYLYRKYSKWSFRTGKKLNKAKLQEELGLVQDDSKFVIGIISRLTDQKGLDLVNEAMDRIVDDYTQVVVIGTGDPKYEDIFRNYEWKYKGSVCSNIMYSNERAHKLYAAADAMLVPSRFEPCGLTQLIALRYGTVPIVRETGGLKDTVIPYNEYTEEGTGFSFDKYDANVMVDTINYAKKRFFDYRSLWDAMVQRDMNMDYSWNTSAKKYVHLYRTLIGW